MPHLQSNESLTEDDCEYNSDYLNFEGVMMGEKGQIPLVGDSFLKKKTTLGQKRNYPSAQSTLPIESQTQ